MQKATLDVLEAVAAKFPAAPPSAVVMTERLFWDLRHAYQSDQQSSVTHFQGMEVYAVNHDYEIAGEIERLAAKGIKAIPVFAASPPTDQGPIIVPCPRP